MAASLEERNMALHKAVKLGARLREGVASGEAVRQQRGQRREDVE